MIVSKNSVCGNIVKVGGNDDDDGFPKTLCRGCNLIPKVRVEQKWSQTDAKGSGFSNLHAVVDSKIYRKLKKGQISASGVSAEGQVSHLTVHFLFDNF